jgi:hypothetical protein
MCRTPISPGVVMDQSWSSVPISMKRELGLLFSTADRVTDAWATTVFNSPTTHGLAYASQTSDVAAAVAKKHYNLVPGRQPGVEMPLQFCLNGVMHMQFSFAKNSLVRSHASVSVG